MFFGKCGDIESDERLGLRSSSDKDRLMGSVGGAERPNELFRGVEGVPCRLPCLAAPGSEDQVGMGGLPPSPGDSATFFAG